MVLQFQIIAVSVWLSRFLVESLQSRAAVQAHIYVSA